MSDKRTAAQASKGKIDPFEVFYDALVSAYQSISDDDLNKCRYQGFDLQKIIKTFCELNANHKKFLVAWMIIRGAKDPLTAKGAPENVKQAATAFYNMLGNGTHNLGSLCNVAGGVLAQFTITKRLPPIIPYEGAPQIVTFISPQYLNFTPSLCLFGMYRACQFAKIFKGPERQTVKTVLEFYKLSMTEESMNWFAKCATKWGSVPIPDEASSNNLCDFLLNNEDNYADDIDYTMEIAWVDLLEVKVHAWKGDLDNFLFERYYASDNLAELKQI